MNKDEILQFLCEHFQMLDDDGKPLLIDGITKQLTYAQLGKHFELISLFFANEINMAFVEGERSGLMKGQKIIEEVFGNDNK